MTCCITVDTPASIQDEYDRDVFAEIVSGDNAELMRRALWARYRFHMIGSCDIDTWVQVMTDRFILIKDKWDAIFRRAATLDLSDLTELSYNRTVQHTPIEGTDGDIRTVAHDGDITTTSERETLPQTVTGETRYLEHRDTDTVDNDQRDTETYAPNTQDTETYTEDRSIAAKTFAAMMDNYPDVLIRFADEFGDFFMDRW